MWGAHLNILQVTFSYWSFYLLKYAMKCEPHGTLNLNIKNAKQLVYKMHQKKFTINLFISKHVSPVKAPLVCLQIPIVQKSRSIQYIDSKPL